MHFVTASELLQPNKIWDWMSTRNVQQLQPRVPCTVPAVQCNFVQRFIRIVDLVTFLRNKYVTVEGVKIGSRI